MYVPFISKLAKRRGGGASSSGGKSGGSSGSSSGGKSGSSGSSSGGKTGSSSSGKTGSSGSSSSGKSSSSSISSGGKSRSASTSSFGGGKPIVIPIGQLFGGRSAGGATRVQVFGTQCVFFVFSKVQVLKTHERSYGSGYPGFYTRGVNGRGFPFYFWPLAWGTGIGYGAGAYMHTNEYGEPTNTSRPGGAMASATFQSNASSTASTFHLIADNTTLTALIPTIASNCSSHLTSTSATSNTTTAFNSSSPSFPEQVVQYFRASSVALTLDGYNNSAVFAPENTTSDSPLPDGTDLVLLECLNATIAQAVPLVDGAMGMSMRASSASVGWVWIWVLVGVLRALAVV
ncbi:hypothetical protein C8F01DRAFT_330085 [Mycena amicta]|nr:hypothetical protein C8F01DRAFT_330085 [Mycena amicta]